MFICVNILFCVRRLFCVNFIIFLLNFFLYRFRVFLPSFEKERRKMLAKRRKKDRGRFLTARRPPRVTHSVCSGVGYNSSAKAGEYFGLFSLEKSFDRVEKKYSRGIPADVRTRYTVSLLPQHHKAGKWVSFPCLWVRDVSTE